MYRVLPFVDQFVPCVLLSQEEDRRSARLTVLLSLLMGLTGPLLVATYGTLGHPLVALQIAMVTVVIVCAMATQWMTRSSYWASQQVLMGLGYVLMVGAFPVGGTSPLLAWSLLLPVLAVGLLGHRLSRAWSGVSGLAFGAFWAL